MQPFSAEPYAAPRGGEEPGFWWQLSGQDLQHPDDPTTSPAPVWSQQLFGLYQHQRSAWGRWENTLGGEGKEKIEGHLGLTGNMCSYWQSCYSFYVLAMSGHAFSLYSCPILLHLFNWLVLNRSVLILICSFPLPIAFLNIWLFSCACLQMWTYTSKFLSSRSPIICEMRTGLSNEPWGTLLITSLYG